MAGDFARVTKRFAHVWEGVTWHALAVNVLFRLLILAFTVDALINAGDDRFAGKALGPRNVGTLLGLSMLSRYCRPCAGSGSAIRCRSTTSISRSSRSTLPETA